MIEHCLQFPQQPLADGLCVHVADCVTLCASVKDYYSLKLPILVHTSVQYNSVLHTRCDKTAATACKLLFSVPVDCSFLSATLLLSKDYIRQGLAPVGLSHCCC
jgi:hypothetical protein